MDLAGFDFTFGEIFAGFVFGVIGIALFRAAKKNLHYPNMAIAGALMVYGLFVRGTWQTWAVGCALCGAAYYFHKNHIP